MPRNSSPKRGRQHVMKAGTKRGVGAKRSVGPTYDQLYADAKRRNIKGRSSMTKAQLQKVLG